MKAEYDDLNHSEMSFAMRNEKIGILEGLSHIHQLHISRLTAIKSGLFCQTLNVSLMRLCLMRLCCCQIYSFVRF